MTGKITKEDEKQMEEKIANEAKEILEIIQPIIAQYIGFKAYSDLINKKIAEVDENRGYECKVIETEQRPLEQLGWHKRQLDDYCETYYKGKDQLNSSVRVSFGKENGELVSIVNDKTITLEELLAIYNTAKQIKDESEV